MKLLDIIKRNSELGGSNMGEKFKVAVISNITINLLKPVLELALREDGVNAEVTIGDYDSIVQDSQRFVKYKAFIIFWETANLVDGFQNISISSHLTDNLVVKVENEIDFVINNLQNIP
jgi:hypothetical protein